LEDLSHQQPNLFDVDLAAGDGELNAGASMPQLGFSGGQGNRMNEKLTN
jgi:hypothetical protein